MKNLLAILLLFSALSAAGQARPEITLDLIRQKDLSMLWTGPLPEIDRLDTTRSRGSIGPNRSGISARISGGSGYTSPPSADREPIR